MNPHTNTSTGLNALQDTIQNNSANQHNQHTVISTKFSRNGWLNNCAHMYTVNPDLFDLATQEHKEQLLWYDCPWPKTCSRASSTKFEGDI